MPAMHRETGLPGAVRMPFHLIGLRIPLVKVADNRNTLGLRRRAYKTHRCQSILCGITVSWFPGISLFFLHIEFVLAINSVFDDPDGLRCEIPARLVVGRSLNTDSAPAFKGVFQLIENTSLSQ